MSEEEDLMGEALSRLSSSELRRLAYWLILATEARKDPPKCQRPTLGLLHALREKWNDESLTRLRSSVLLILAFEQGRAFEAEMLKGSRTEGTNGD